MQVFKVYFKVVKKNMPQMMIFLFIFIGLSIAFVNVGVGKAQTEFSNTKPDIAIFSDEGETLIVKGLRDYLGKAATIINIKNDENSRRDALFFRKVTYILQIPSGFSDNLLKGGDGGLIQKTVPDSYDSFYIDQLINKYCKAVQVYSKFADTYSQTEILKMVDTDLAKGVDVTLKGVQKSESPSDNSIYFFNYFAYSLFAIIMLGVSSFMITFQDMDLRRRNNSSPLSLRSMNFQLVLGNIVFAMAVWFLLYGLSFVLYGQNMVNTNAIYYAINTIVYTIVCVSISFLVGNVTSSRGAQAAIVNVLALGLSFISGVFVPQFLLGETVLNIAKFTPTYWYIRANNLINQINPASGFNFGNISAEILVQLAFAIGLFVVAGVVIHRKRTDNA